VIRLREPMTTTDDLESWPRHLLIQEVQRLREQLRAVRHSVGAPSPSPSSRARKITQDFPAPPLSDGTVPSFARGQSDAQPATFAIPARNTATPPADQGLDFGAVSRLSPEELDGLPYGLITLDADGRILHYNDTESRMVGVPKEAVLGKRFFGEVAPCARVREFQGRFEELVRDPHRIRVQTFDFVFRFANGDQQVTIVMTPARARGQYNVALLRRA
jgi:photoactive yellow protein